MSEWIPYKDGDEMPNAYAYWIVTKDRTVVLGERIYLKANRWGFRDECGRVDDVTHYIPINRPEAP